LNLNLLTKPSYNLSSMAQDPKKNSPLNDPSKAPLPDDPEFAQTQNETKEDGAHSPIPSVESKDKKKKDSKFLHYLKRAAFSVWAVVMTIGMILAFLISLFLV